MADLPKSPNAPDPDAEARLRAAWGLGDQQDLPASPPDAAAAPAVPVPAPRRRGFVRDGDVPVTRTKLQPPDRALVNRRAAAEQALAEERRARAAAEQALATAQESIQHLQTKLAHAELAKRELAAARDALAAELREQPVAPVACAASEATPQAPRRGRKRKAENAAETAGGPVRGRRKDETEPVKWWVPGWNED